MFTSSGEHVINFLQTLPTDAISNEDCAIKMSAGNARRITDSKMCGFSGIGRGTCFGDEGGPLVALREVPFSPPVAELIGIVSWQAACGAGYPDVYERMSNFQLWIRSNI